MYERHSAWGKYTSDFSKTTNRIHEMLNYHVAAYDIKGLARKGQLVQKSADLSSYIPVCCQCRWIWIHSHRACSGSNCGVFETLQPLRQNAVTAARVQPACVALR